MKTIHRIVLGITLSTAAFGQLDGWSNRPAVLALARILATQVEHLDDALHGSGAPEDFIRKVHHLEETVVEFVEIVAHGTYGEAAREFNHIREDVRFLDGEFPRYPHLLANPRIARDWRDARAAYRRVDHEMLRAAYLLLAMGESELENE